MVDDKSNRKVEGRAEVLRLVDECRRLLEQTGKLAKQLEELTKRLADDQSDSGKPTE
jgi:uncharacterized protein YlxW (UPF0749 family)